MATPTTTSRLGRVARMSSRGSLTGPVKVISPRVTSSFWPYATYWPPAVRTLPRTASTPPGEVICSAPLSVVSMPRPRNCRWSPRSTARLICVARPVLGTPAAAASAPSSAAGAVASTTSTSLSSDGASPLLRSNRPSSMPILPSTLMASAPSCSARSPLVTILRSMRPSNWNCLACSCSLARGTAPRRALPVSDSSPLPPCRWKRSICAWSPVRRIAASPSCP